MSDLATGSGAGAIIDDAARPVERTFLIGWPPPSSSSATTSRAARARGATSRIPRTAA